jgi:hypothetical protein
MLMVPQLAAQLRVPLAPRFEVPADRVKEPGFARGPFMDGRPAEETRAQLRVPADVVPLAHLILEEPRQQEALRACHFLSRGSLVRVQPGAPIFSVVYGHS